MAIKLPNVHIVAKFHLCKTSSLLSLQRDYEHVNGAPRLPERPPSLQSSPLSTAERKGSVITLQSYMEPSPTIKYGFHNHGVNLTGENGTMKSDKNDNQYLEIQPEPSMPSNGHIILHNQDDDVTYDNTSDLN